MGGTAQSAATIVAADLRDGRFYRRNQVWVDTTVEPRNAITTGTSEISNMRNQTTILTVLNNAWIVAHPDTALPAQFWPGGRLLDRNR